MRGAMPDALGGRVLTFLDITWGAMWLLSLALGGLLVDAWASNRSLAAASVLLAVSRLVWLRGLRRYSGASA